jgi:surface protein
VPPKASNGPEAERVYTPFTDKIFGSGPVNNEAPIVEDIQTQRVYIPFSDRIFGHEPAINKVHEVPGTYIGDKKPFGHEEEEVQGNEFTQLDESPPAFQCFTNHIDLVAAVDEYLFDNGPNTFVAQTYGWPIGTWCVSQVKSFRAVFSANRNPAASAFDEDLSNWDVSNATSTQNMFEGSAIDQNFSTWNTSAVKLMNSMFSDTKFFQGKGLSKWDTRSVTDMSFMFSNAISLREDISSWNVSSVKSTWGMFQFASSFNHDLSPWTLRGLVSMDLMFNGATSFRYDLCKWVEHVPKDLVNTYGVFTMSNCPNANDPDLSTYSPGPFCFDC